MTVSKKVFALVRRGFAATHWTRGALSTKKAAKSGEYKMSYCSLGGIAQVLALPADDRRVVPYATALVKSMPREFVEEWIKGTTLGTAPTYEEFLTAAHNNRHLNVVISYNDAETCKLEDILALFKAAEDSAEDVDAGRMLNDLDYRIWDEYGHVKRVEEPATA